MCAARHPAGASASGPAEIGDLFLHDLRRAVTRAQYAYFIAPHGKKRERLAALQATQRALLEAETGHQTTRRPS